MASSPASRPSEPCSRGHVAVPAASVIAPHAAPIVARCAALLLALGVVASTSGCAMMKQMLFTPQVRDCEGFDVPLTTLAVSSRKELRVRVLTHRVDYDFPFVVESSADSFVLVGFTPMGTKAFTLVRHGDVVEVDNKIGPGMPVPPRNTMSDLLAMSVPSPCATSPDGVATATVGVWQLSDTCKDNRPVQRRLAKPGGKEEIEIDYPGDAIVVHQQSCRYNARYVLQGAGAAPMSKIGDAVDEGAK